MKKQVILLAVIGSLGHAASAVAQRCDAQTRGPAADALDAVHVSRGGSVEQARTVVERFLPMVLRLGAPGVSGAEWEHVAVDIGRELVRLGRKDEASRVFQLVTETAQDDNWKEKAARHLGELRD